MQECITRWSALVRNLVESGMTQAQIAAATGADPSTISRIARGESADVKFAIAERLIELGGGCVRWPELAGARPRPAIAAPDHAALAREAG